MRYTDLPRVVAMGIATVLLVNLPHHWVVIYVGRNGCVEYFDPLGNLMPNEIAAWIDEHYGTHIENNIRVQGPLSKSCGHFCIYYASVRLCGVSVKQIYNVFTHNYVQNENVVTDYVKCFS